MRHRPQRHVVVEGASIDIAPLVLSQDKLSRILSSVNHR